MFDRILERIETKMNGAFLKPNNISVDGLKIIVGHNTVDLISWMAVSELEKDYQLRIIKEKFGLKIE